MKATMMYGVDDLILFVKTVEIGSFANTAKVLKVAPQAVSRRSETWKTVWCYFNQCYNQRV